MADQPEARAATAENDTLVQRVAAYVERYMAHYDGSHDYNHIRRVLGLALRIAQSSPAGTYDVQIVTLAALLHDVGDKKYLRAGEDSRTLVRNVLHDELGVDAQLAQTVQTIVSAVSYSSEIRDPQRVQHLIRSHPELAVVQDADRLDAIGAVGIGRTFTFGGAMDKRNGKGAAADEADKARVGAASGRGMAETIDHFGEKLVRLEGMMKTDAGKKMARDRTERLLIFQSWWEEEIRAADEGLEGMSPI